MQQRIDWDQIPIVVESKDQPNPQNPHAAASPQERAESLATLARQIMLRRVLHAAHTHNTYAHTCKPPPPPHRCCDELKGCVGRRPRPQPQPQSQSQGHPP